MSKLIIMQGLPASGKSTRAQELIKTHGNAVRINRDLLREMLHFGKWSGVNEGLTIAGAHSLAKEYLKAGLTVIIDDTNLNTHTVDSWKELARTNDAKVQIERMETPVEECLRRDMGRAKEVGKSVIVGMALSAGLYPKPQNGVVLCDIDGTLADISHRLHFVKAPKICMTGEGEHKLYGDDPDFKKDWNSFFGGIHADKPRRDVVDMLLEHEKQGREIFLISARPETYRNATEGWLENIAFNGRPLYKALFMRRAHDKRPDTEVKADILRQCFPDYSWIREVIDDRPSVIRMWREQGLNVVDVGSGVEF